LLAAFLAQRRRCSFVVVLAVLAAFALVLTARVARADILIGAAGPLTGSHAWLGEQTQQGAQMAVRDLNGSGGLLGEKVKLVIADDACEGPQAVAAAEKLVGDGVVFVVGHACSAASIPASEVYYKAGVVQISPGSTNPMLTELGRSNVFRVCGRDDLQGVLAGDYLADHFAGSRIAIVHDGATYGKGLAEETKRELNKRGVAETLFETIAPEQSDYSRLIEKLRAAGVSVLYYGGYAAGAGLIARTAREAGLALKLISGDALSTKEFMLVAGLAGEGTVFTFFPDPRQSPAAAEVIDRFHKSGFDPEGQTLYSYAAVQVWSQAVEKAGGTAADKVIAALHSNKFATVLGSISFDAKGDVEQPRFEWYVWRTDSYEALQ
jgi:branched-chain amino acid transport system substrate-binding protein